MYLKKPIYIDRFFYDEVGAKDSGIKKWISVDLSTVHSIVWKYLFIGHFRRTILNAQEHLDNGFYLLCGH